VRRQRRTSSRQSRKQSNKSAKANLKKQIPNSKQAPNYKLQKAFGTRLVNWQFVFGIYLGFVILGLGFHARGGLFFLATSHNICYVSMLDGD
jgi:hypothetical protein